MRGTRKALATAVAVLGVAVAPGAAQAAETWTQVGGTISSAPVASGQYDIKRIAGTPYIAYTDTSGAADQVRVVRLNSSGAWVAVGGPLNSDPAADASGASLVAGPGDVPWISWLEEEDDGLVRVRVARYDTATGKWVEVAPNSVINRIDEPERYLSSAVQTKIVFVDGRAHVVFRQNNLTAYEVGHVRLSADGNSWERLASPAVPNEPYFVTAHVSGGSLYAAARDMIGGVYVYRYTAAGTWQQLGVMANPVQDGQPVPTRTTALASFGGVIYVAHSVGEAHAVYVTRFVNGSWQTVPDIAGEGPVSSLRVIGGRLYVGWAHARAARTARLSAAGTAWEGTTIFPAGVQSPILTGVGGVPYAVTRTDIGELQAYRLSGTTTAGPDDNDDSEPPKPVPSPCGKERVGTKYGDRITGTSARDTIRGLGGNDRIFGLGGADCLFGDAGDDRIEGGDGEDTLDGGAGDDRLISGNGNDTVTGGSGDDVIDSRGKGYDTIDCGPGYDRVMVGDLDRVRNCERVLNVD